jgi:hypothetical protein
MTPIFIGKCLDVAVPFAAGLIGLFYYPRRIARDVESGKVSAADGKKRLNMIKPACYFGILFGIYKASTFFW